jgi:hypothetical protein
MIVYTFMDHGYLSGNEMYNSFYTSTCKISISNNFIFYNMIFSVLYKLYRRHQYHLDCQLQLSKYKKCHKFPFRILNNQYDITFRKRLQVSCKCSLLATGVGPTKEKKKIRPG